VLLTLNFLIMDAESVGLGGLLAILGAYLVFVLAIAVVMLISMWKIYSKAGQPGWAVLVPIYNLVVLLNIVRKPVWWILLMCIPFVNFIIAILIYLELAKVFNKDTAFGLGIVFLPLIFIPMLAFGKSEYQHIENQ
jgi:hypothetical protein